MLEEFRRAEPNKLPEMTRQEFLRNVEALLQKPGLRVSVASDFDRTLSQEHPRTDGRLDPRDTTAHPGVKEAVQRILDSGHSFILVSSRGTADGEAKIGLKSAGGKGSLAFVGSLGWETRDVYDHVHVHERFIPYEDTITGILRGVRERLMRDDLHLDPTIPMEPNIVLPIPDGNTDDRIILQPKGYTDEEGFPEGLNHTWIFSAITDSNLREKYAQRLIQYFSEELEKIISDPQKREEFRRIWGMHYEPATPTDTPDLEFRPMSQITKSHAALHLLREAQDPRRDSYMQGLPTSDVIIYLGDHPEQDSILGRAGLGIDHYTGGRKGMVHVWVRNGERQLPEGYDTRRMHYVVDGVAENVELLTQLAELFERYPQHQAT